MTCRCSTLLALRGIIHRPPVCGWLSLVLLHPHSQPSALDFTRRAQLTLVHVSPSTCQLYFYLLLTQGAASRVHPIRAATCCNQDPSIVLQRMQSWASLCMRLCIRSNRGEVSCNLVWACAQGLKPQRGQSDVDEGSAQLERWCGRPYGDGDRPIEPSSPLHCLQRRRISSAFSQRLVPRG